MFFKVSRQIFPLDTFGQQADKYITRGGMFFMFFYVSMFAYEPGKVTTTLHVEVGRASVTTDLLQLVSILP